jgi:hypothetical protein
VSQVAVGGALLLTISLYSIYGVAREQRDRSIVLAHGRDAQARVIRTTGLESVMIEWSDGDGKQRTAESRTGKVFARSSLGKTVLIKYDHGSVREPVILSEVPERERINIFWLRSSVFVGAGLSAICAAAFYIMRRERRMSAGAAPK